MSRIFCKCMFVSEESGLVILFSFSRTYSILVYFWGSEWNWYWCYWSNNCWIINKPVDPFKIYIFQVTNALLKFFDIFMFFIYMDPNLYSEYGSGSRRWIPVGILDGSGSEKLPTAILYLIDLWHEFLTNITISGEEIETVTHESIWEIIAHL